MIMVRKNRPHLRLVVDNTAAPATPTASSPLYSNTMVRTFWGPFAHLRARISYDDLVDWGIWQVIGWHRFSLLNPRTWFCARLEATTALSIREWTWLELCTRAEFGRRWRLHHPHRAYKPAAA